MKRLMIIPGMLLLMAAATTPVQAANPHNTLDCLICHQDLPKFGIDTKDSVTFREVSPDDPSLCFRCHQPEENLHPLLITPVEENLDTRAPAALPMGFSAGLEGKIVCTTCHFVHAANTEYALLRGFPGSQNPDLFKKWQDFCRSCHGQNLEKRSPHQGDEKACVFCHQATPQEGRPIDVAPKGIDLCNFCHQGIKNRHYDKANPFETEVSCQSCHDPHLGPDSPGRLKADYFEAARDKVAIDPHYRKALCFTCHKEGKDYSLLTDDMLGLCNRCHASEEIVGDVHPLREVPASITIPEGWPLQDGALSCLTCHRAGHAEDRSYRKFLRGDPPAEGQDFCLKCHSEDAYIDKDPHAEINMGGGCEFCHSARPLPGKDTHQTVKLLAGINVLCLRCHEENPHPGGVEHSVTVDRERLSSISDELPLFNNSITCATCHNPHIEDVGSAKLRGVMISFEICGKCHRH